jgi:ribosomal protein S18 acetylase RimI-like enzyme
VEKVLMKNKKIKRYREFDEWEQDSDNTFYIIAGYTGGGAPYGITCEEFVKDELIVRRALRKDANQAAELIYLAIDDIAERLTGQTKPENIRKTLSTFFREENNRLSYQNTIVADINGEVAGLVITYPGEDSLKLDEPFLNILKRNKRNQNISFDKEADEGDYYIDTLCVSPKFQGFGIGTLLIKEAEKLALTNGHQRISINVAQDNPLAKKLYKKLGYMEEKNIQINGHDYEYLLKELMESQ